MVFMMHAFDSDEVARKIGWTAGSPFQLEVAVANLAIAVLGIISYWQREKFWLAIVIVYSVFLYGATGVHVSQIISNNNNAQYNSEFFLWLNDIILPGIFLVLFFYYLKVLKANNSDIL